MWELDYKDSWAPKNWCFWTVVLEKTLDSPLDCKEIQPVHSEGDQSWVSIGRTNAKAKTPVLWPADVKSWLIRKDPDADKDWRWEEKGTTEVGWHHQLNGHEFEQAPGNGEGQLSLACCSPSQRVGHNWATERQQQEHSIFLPEWTFSHDQFGRWQENMPFWCCQVFNKFYMEEMTECGIKSFSWQC